MSEPESPPRPEHQSLADRTLLGVAPPRLDSGTESLTRSPVLVRAGTATTDVPPPSVPRKPLPSHPPPGIATSTAGVSEAPAAPIARSPAAAWAIATLNRPVRLGETQVTLWKLLGPGLLVVGTVGVLLLSWLSSAAKASRATPTSVASSPQIVAPAPPPQDAVNEAAALASLASKDPESLSSSQLLTLADVRVERERSAARALRRKLEDDPGRAKDRALQGELLRQAADADTAREALATMARLEAPLGADLLYEVWTGNAVKNATTELARTLVYSTDVRPKASPALDVALQLRSSETCEQFRTALPLALKDGDRRALHLLTKLTSKRGCGPKKSQDCFACLREQADELTATLNAVKSRRPPSYPTP